MSTTLDRHAIKRGDYVTYKEMPGVHVTPEQLNTFKRVVSVTLIRAHADRHLPTSQQRVVTRYVRLEGEGTLTAVECLTKVD